MVSGLYIYAFAKTTLHVERIAPRGRLVFDE